MSKRLIISSLLASSFCAPGVASAYEWLPPWMPDTAAVPFAFSSSTLGNTIGVAGLLKGLGQPQAGLIGAGLISDKGSNMTFIGYNNFQVGNAWLLGFDAYNASYSDYIYHLGSAGDNDSLYSQKTVTDAEEAQYHFTMRYIIPWGAAAFKGARAAYEPKRRIQGASPATSGISTVKFEPFLSERSLSSSNDSAPDSTWGVNLGFEWDNRNDVRNPSLGAKLKLNIAHAPDSGNDNTWTKVEIEQSHYFSLGKVDDVFSRQVLAFDMYVADTPTWNRCGSGTCERPPEYAGVSLGGLYHLRGYSANRYHGRSAVHYSLEYRVMPEWQPLQSWPIFNWYDVPWWQWVAFVDAGRVADEFSIQELHRDMKYNLGGGIRFQVEGIVVRTEMAFGDEENMFRVMINQPF